MASMLRLIRGCRGLNAGEAAAVDRLREASLHVVLADGGLDEVDHAPCAALLEAVDSAAVALGAALAPRTYRQDFTPNYKALFPEDGGRMYRVDVLDTCLAAQSDLWVNGERFELSSAARSLGDILLATCFDLRSALDRWHAGKGNDHEQISRGELVAVLEQFDAAWADFEYRYIGELIAIEARARQMLVTACSVEAELHELETCAGFVPKQFAAQETEQKLVQCIAHLNSVANFKCKGRDDLGYPILEAARKILERCEGNVDSPAGAAARGAARQLALDVLDSYAAMRRYLRRVGSWIDHVDPHLCNNPGLVERLVDWETCWEVGARYILQERLLNAVCDVVAEVRAAQSAAPELAEMCEDCDVELFMVLPRMIILLFAADPARERTGLLQSLLPHRFSSLEEKRGCDWVDGLHPDLRQLCERFQQVLRLLAESCSVPGQQAGMQDMAVARQRLMNRAISGAGSKEAYGSDGPPVSPAARDAAEGFMRALEGWSLELQRHCPQDWNQCSAVLIQCVSAAATSAGADGNDRGRAQQPFAV